MINAVVIAVIFNDCAMFMSIKRSYKLIYQCASWWRSIRYEH